MDFLADERIHDEQQSKSSIFVPPLLELGQILEGTRIHRELTNVEVLQGDEKCVELIHDLGFGTCC